MKNNHNQPIDEDALRRALQRGTERTAASSPALWSRILNARANGGGTRRGRAKPWIALGATALAAAALVLALPRWLSVPDVVRPPVTAPAQPSANTAVSAQPSAAPQMPLATAGGSLLDGRFPQAANGDASLSQLYTDVLAMVRNNDSNAPAAVSQLMEVLLARRIDLSTPLYALTTGKNGGDLYTTLEKLEGKSALGDVSGLDQEQKAFLEELFAAGYTIRFGDGQPYAQIRYTDFRQQFSVALDDELKTYLTLIQTETDRAYQIEGQLLISTEELAQRCLAAQDYLDKYDEHAQNKSETHPWRTQDITYLHNAYLSGLLTLHGYLFSGEGFTVPQEYRTTYDALITANQSSHPDFVALLSQYKALLQAGDWTLNDDIRNFLSEHRVSGYGPAPRLIWAELSIYGVRLDSDGETAIPKLNKTIGATPVSDNTVEDAGGKTRTLQWSNGTIATLRNGKVYSLETTAAQAPLVRGLRIGDPTETLTAYLGQPLRKEDVWTWGVGSNDNVFAWLTGNQLARFKVSLTE